MQDTRVQFRKTPRDVRFRVALIGARGYVGGELLKLLVSHPRFEVVLITSRELAGKPVAEVLPEVALDVSFEATDPAQVETLRERGIDIWVLALPNGNSKPWVAAIDDHCPDDLIIDLSSDHRFDASWTYGLPEVKRDAIVKARRIANPGCYATGAQLALYPLLDLLDGPAHVFGVSGYSGAGTRPSPRNDPEALKDNLVPYALTGHGHEDEIRWQLGHRVFFMPHVAPFFSGIVLTVSMPLRHALEREALWQRYVESYRYEPLVTVQEEIPLPRDAAGQHRATIGGLSFIATDRHAVAIVTLDNLLKGAATQCLQNMNLASGIDELAGLRAYI